jgi:hypothetical protein
MVPACFGRTIQHRFHRMSTSNSSAPGSSTPGGELEQISPGAWPTENGGQAENSVPSLSSPSALRLPNPSAAKQVSGKGKDGKSDSPQKQQGIGRKFKG